MQGPHHQGSAGVGVLRACTCSAVALAPGLERLLCQGLHSFLQVSDVRCIELGHAGVAVIAVHALFHEEAFATEQGGLAAKIEIKMLLHVCMGVVVQMSAQ